MSSTQFLSVFLRCPVFSILGVAKKISLFSGVVFIGTLTGCSHKAGPPMPLFKILLMDSSTLFSSDEIPTGKPIALIYFSPDCEHCQAETAGLICKMDSLQDVRFYFITTDPFERLRLFNHHYHLSKYANIVLGKDHLFSFFNRLKPMGTPSTFIYDRHKILKAVLSGYTEPGKIIFLTKNI